MALHSKWRCKCGVCITAPRPNFWKKMRRLTWKLRRKAIGNAASSGNVSLHILAGAGIFLFATASRSALGPTQTPIQCAPGSLSLGVRGWPLTSIWRRGQECVELYLHSPYVFMAWCSVKAQGQLYLIIILSNIINYLMFILKEQYTESSQQPFCPHYVSTVVTN
jgi:hypothetical protein